MTTTYEADIPNPGEHWWLVLIQGIVAIILGVLLLVYPASTLMVLVTILGLYWFFAGIINLISLFWNRSQWGWKVFNGILGIIAGAFILGNPILSTFLVPASFALVIGIIGVVIGISLLIQALRGAGFGIGALGALSIFLGLIMIVQPFVTGFTLAFLLAFLSILGGVVAIIASFSVRRLSRHYEEVEARAMQETPPVGSAVPITGAPTEDVMTGVAGAGAVGLADEDIDTAPRMDEEIAGVETPSATGYGAEEMPTYRQPLESIEGVGPENAAKLRAIGIGDSQDLYEAGRTAEGRGDIAARTGISDDSILEWVHRVDLYRIRGVDAEYVVLLVAAGVHSMVELAQQNPAYLYESLNSVNQQMHPTRSMPIQSQVEDWVAQARVLPRQVT